jgi:hypothetical protein
MKLVRLDSLNAGLHVLGELAVFASSFSSRVQSVRGRDDDRNCGGHENAGNEHNGSLVVGVSLYAMFFTRMAKMGFEPICRLRPLLLRQLRIPFRHSAFIV